MLFVLFQLGQGWYAIEARRVVEVLPLVTLKPLPQAPRGVAGLFNYRGRPVPALDLSELALSQPAPERLSTRIIVVRSQAPGGANQLLGLIAEHATETMRREPAEFVEPSTNVGVAPCLGPILMDPQRPIQWIREQRLLSTPVWDLLLSQLKDVAA